MTRTLVKYEYVTNERARKATMQKRKPSLFKKISELKCLCDVDACLVMYENNEAPVDVWPSPAEADRLINKFQNSVLLNPRRAMLNQEGLLQINIYKLEKELEKVKKKNLKHVMVKSLLDPNGFSENNPLDRKDLSATIETEIMSIDDMIKSKTCKENIV